jgi:probable O-glycosylation ligase (exosortase A-associated)
MVQGPFYGLLFYLWYAYFRPDYWMWDPSLITPLNLSLVIGIVLLVSCTAQIDRFRLTRHVGLILLFLLQSIISLVASEHREWSMFYWTEFLKVIVITLLITFLLKDRKQFRLALLVIGYSLGLEAAKQGWAQLILNPGASNINTHPVLGDNNGVAVGMMMLVPVFSALAQTATRKWEKFVHRFFIVGLFYRGISTYSRGGFLTAGAIGMIGFWRSKRKVRVLLGMVVLSAIVVSVMPPEFWSRMGTLQNSEQDQDASAKGRIYFWHVAWRMANAKPLTGVGFNGFRPSFPIYDYSDGKWGDDRAVHSTWFGVLSEMGYPGLMLLVSIILVSLQTCRRVRVGSKKRKDLRDLELYAIALQTSFVAYCVGMSFLNGQYVEMFWHYVGLTVALERVYAEAAAVNPDEADAAVVLAPAPDMSVFAPAMPAGAHFHAEPDRVPS